MHCYKIGFGAAEPDEQRLFSQRDLALRTWSGSTLRLHNSFFTHNEIAGTFFTLRNYFRIKFRATRTLLARKPFVAELSSPLTGITLPVQYFTSKLLDMVFTRTDLKGNSCALNAQHSAAPCLSRGSIVGSWVLHWKLCLSCQSSIVSVYKSSII